VHLLPAVSPGSVNLSVRAVGAASVAECAALLDARPDTLPGEEALVDVRPPTPPAAPAAEARREDVRRFRLKPSAAPGLADGRAWVHVRARDGHGAWVETLHLPVIVDSAAPAPSRVRPEPGGLLTSRRLRVRFDEAGAVDRRSIVLTIGRENHAIGRHLTRYNAAAKELLVDLAAAEFSGLFTEGKPVTVTLRSVADRAGNRLAGPVEWTWTYRPAADRTPPPAPRARFTTESAGPRSPFGGGYGNTNGFEDVLGEVFSFGGCTVRRTDGHSAFGRSSAEATPSTPGGFFRLRLRERYFRASVHTRLIFDCRAPKGSALDLEVDLMGVTRTVNLVGRRPGVEYHGSARGLDIGRGWRRFYVDLGSACADELERMPLKYGRRIFLVGRLPAGGACQVDNVEISRADWPGAHLEWELPADDSGVRGFSYAYDRMPETEPPEAVMSAAPSALEAGEPAGRYAPPFSTKGGVWYFHIRACDGAGNWGPATHYPVDYGDLGARKGPLRVKGPPPRLDTVLEDPE